MAAHATHRQSTRSAYAGLNFIKAAFCPLEFNAVKLASHLLYRWRRRDDALAPLRLGHFPAVAGRFAAVIRRS
jgi:hypothetical protein